ncbi:hypothetical protein ICN76_008470, partial [Streptomyces sp. BRB081]|nr:hypothetical protein [Streptomyces sp. BRB081]
RGPRPGPHRVGPECAMPGTAWDFDNKRCIYPDDLTPTQALLRLARQRVSVLFAMLRDGTFYQSRTPNDVELAA